MSGVDREKVEKYLEPLALSLLALGQRPLVERYLDIIGAVKEDESYKHIRFFWSCALELDVAKFDKCYFHLEALRDLSVGEHYDIEKCERFYAWRKESM